MARFAITYQQLQNNHTAAGDTDDVQRLAEHLRQRLFDGRFALTTVMPYMGGLNDWRQIPLLAADPATYAPYEKLLTLSAEIPEALRGRASRVVDELRALVTSWLEHDAPEAGNSPVLRNGAQAATVAIEVVFVTRYFDVVIATQ